MSVARTLDFVCDAGDCRETATVKVAPGDADSIPPGWYAELGNRVHACCHQHCDVINAAQLEKTGKRYIWLEWK